MTDVPPGFLYGFVIMGVVMIACTAFDRTSAPPGPAAQPPTPARAENGEGRA
ncbi:hypothetical protein [Actinomadura craniellae]|uniref:hypothetical protein n=1 Tax=Actinomadura craniellae TaxID=2231787 RepID=UPI0013143B80|nr:hypothetical protein [Actinomadura craniellae]